MPSSDDQQRALLNSVQRASRLRSAAMAQAPDPIISLGRLQNLMLSQTPSAIPQEQVIVLTEGQPYFRGTTAPVVKGRWAPRASGLIVPAGLAHVDPLDLMGAYITLEDLIGFPVSWEIINGQTSKQYVDDCLRFTGYWLGHIEGVAADEHAIEAKFVEYYINGSAKQQASIMLAQGRRLLVPQLLLAFAKLAVIRGQPSSGEVPGSSQEPMMAITMLALGDYLSPSESELENTAPSEHTAGLSDELLLDLTSNLYFNSTVDEGGCMARFFAMWIRSEERTDDGSSLSDLFEEATGISLLDAAACTVGLWARASVRNEFAVQPEYFANVSVGTTIGKKVLDFFSIDVAALRVEIARTLPQASAWSYSEFERFPLIRLSNGDYLVISPRFLMRRLFDGLAYWDIHQYLSRGGRKSRLGGLTRLRGKITENYVLSVLYSMVPKHSSIGRLFLEDDLESAFPGSQKCDAVLEYADAFCLMEITSGRLRRETAAGLSLDDLDRDIQRIVVDKGEQLEATIANLRARPDKLTGQLPIPRKFLPIIIVDDSFPVHPGTVQRFNHHLAENGYLQGSDVSPIEIISLEELDIIESLASQGLTIPDIFSAKHGAGLAKMSLKSFVLAESGWVPRRTQRVDDLFHLCINLMKDHMADRLQ